jgi:aminoglycoside 3-N-acetyltransferase
LTEQGAPDLTASTNQTTVSYRDIVRGLRSLRIDRDKPVFVHSSLRAFGRLQGGAAALLGALLSVFDSVSVPTFTYNTLVVPEVGPPDNAIQYGAFTDRNMMAEFFHQDLPADRLMGILAETLRQQPGAFRSGHPALSFAGIDAKAYLEKQIIKEPLAPIAAMYDAGGWVLLIGVDHTVNTSIHLGERLAGRKTFIRWALMTDMIVACPKFPYCSDGFNAIQPLLDPFTKKVQVGGALIQAIPVPELVDTTRQLLQADPTALLCSRTDCQSCNAIRRHVYEKKQDGN